MCSDSRPCRAPPGDPPARRGRPPLTFVPAALGSARLGPAALLAAAGCRAAPHGAPVAAAAALPAPRREGGPTCAGCANPRRPPTEGPPPAGRQSPAGRQARGLGARAGPGPGPGRPRTGGSAGVARWRWRQWGQEEAPGRGRKPTRWDQSLGPAGGEGTKEPRRATSAPSPGCRVRADKAAERSYSLKQPFFFFFNRTTRLSSLLALS